MKTYICKEPVVMSRERFDYLNKVLLVNFDDTDLTMQELIKELGVEPNSSSIETLYWEFENGSFIYEDIYIGDENAYDDVRWYANAQDYPETFDCRYEIAETMKFYVDDVEYICKIKIKEDN